MDFGSVVVIIQESLYFIVVFTLFLGFAMAKGKQALIHIILSLYFALLISLQFPYYDLFLSGAESKRLSDSVIMIVIFAVFTVASMLIFRKLIPHEGDTAFESFGKKALFAISATILVMVFSYHALPVTDIYTPGSPVQALFGNENSFFWWLLVPIVSLLLL